MDQAVAMESRFFPLSVQITSKGNRVVKNPYEAHPRYQKSNRPAYIKNFHKIYKIIIPYGQKYDQKWLLNCLVNECGVHFRAFQFHYEKKKAVFYVDSFPIARLLWLASNKIQGAHHYKIVIKVLPCQLIPNQIPNMQYIDTSEHSCLSTLQSLDQNVDHIKNCLQKRYNQTLQILDLSNLSSDPGLLSAEVYLSFSNLSVIDLLIQIIGLDFPQLICLSLSKNWITRLAGFSHLFYGAPQLKILDLSNNSLYYTQELDFIHNLELTELYLQGNPLCENMENFTAYCRLILHHFPTIQKLDGHIIRQILFLGPEVPQLLPPAKGSFFCNDDIRSFLQGFLQQFFSCYDSRARQSLLPLYQENCYWSLCVPRVLRQNAWFELIQEYWKENRNMKGRKRAGMRQKLLKYDRQQTVGFLCNLPETKHDLQTMIVEVSLQTPSMIFFSIEGRFKKVKKINRNAYISFRRTFIIVPTGDNRAQITNDQLVITDLFVSLPETDFQKPFRPMISLSKDPAAIEPGQSKLCLDEPQTMEYKLSELPSCEEPATVQQNIVQHFARCTGMKPTWAFK
nr:TPA: hypothetical protein GDO54_011482 [Pyxicephalus adspersus]